MNTNETTILELLSEYKWFDQHRCRKCGHPEYKKGKKHLSRRCKECDYDESVTAFTAFEGLKDVVKAYNVIEYLFDHCVFDHDKKTIAIEKRRQKSDDSDLTDMHNEGESISVNELVSRYVGGDISRPASDALLAKNYEEHTINVSEIARRFELEENTVSKLLKKIDNRLAIVRDEDWGGPAEHIFDFLKEGFHNMEYLLGLLMFPMDESWIRGEKKVNGKWYKIYPPSKLRENLDDQRWRIVLQTFHIKDKGYFYSKPGEPEYPCEN